MKKVKMFLFAKWMATCYSGELNAQNGYWWKEKLIHFNKVVYPNMIKNGTVKDTKEFLKD